LSLCLTNQALRHEDIWGSASLILDLGTSWTWVVSFMPRPLYQLGKNPWYPLDRRLGGAPESVWTRWKRENSCPYRDSNSIISAVKHVASRYTDWAISAPSSCCNLQNDHNVFHLSILILCVQDVFYIFRVVLIVTDVVDMFFIPCFEISHSFPICILLHSLNLSLCIPFWFQRILAMVYNTRDYWVFGLGPLSRIPKNTTFRELDLFPSSGHGVGNTYSIWSVRKS
jgi:hypothetical protein